MQDGKVGRVRIDGHAQDDQEDPNKCQRTFDHPARPAAGATIRYSSVVKALQDDLRWALEFESKMRAAIN